MACAGRARFMRLGRLDLTPSLRAFCCRAPSCKSLAAAPSHHGALSRRPGQGQPLALASCAVLACHLGALARATRVLHR